MQFGYCVELSLFRPENICYIELCNKYRIIPNSVIAVFGQKWDNIWLKIRLKPGQVKRIITHWPSLGM